MHRVDMVAEAAASFGHGFAASTAGLVLTVHTRRRELTGRNG
jgi:hypothetical protein